MTPQDFCYWLQGALELTSTNTFDEQQVAIIKEHLSLVFKKETKISLNEMPTTVNAINNLIETTQARKGDDKICLSYTGSPSNVRYC